MSTALSNPQKRYLRGLAHDLKPIVMVGAKGITPSLVAELDQALDQHELVKVKVAAEDRETRDAWIADLAGQSEAESGQPDRPYRRALPSQPGQTAGDPAAGLSGCN